MKVSFDINTASFARVTAKIHRKKNDAIYVGKKAVHDTAELVFAESQIRIPRKTGALAQSGKLEHQDTNQAAISVIGYGDSSTNPVTGRTTASYAVEKHESPRNGKWLENSLLDCSEIYKEELQTQITRALS